jgi:SAM-dependent methyltransferase
MDTKVIARLFGVLRPPPLGGKRPAVPPLQAGDDGPRVPVPGNGFQDLGHRLHSQGVFVGCPLDGFELTARDPLCLALMEGLDRDSVVLEVGCGCLRVGYWFIDYLNHGKYCGIEPNARMLAAGSELLLGDLARVKRPRFSCNDDFDFGVFGTAFDQVIAFSIWSHASKRQISAMLDSFKKTAKPGARFLASWFPPREGMPDYQGTSWVGRSHQSDQPGVIAHDPNWLKTAASSRGLGCRFFNSFTTHGQNWVIVSRP